MKERRKREGDEDREMKEEKKRGRRKTEIGERWREEGK